MKSALYLAAAVVAGLSTQTLAADQAATPATIAPAVAAQAAALNAGADAQTARQLLVSQGYSNVSELNRDTKGHWVGTAVKDGKTMAVAIAVPKASTGSKTN